MVTNMNRVHGNKICLSQLQNGATDALQNIVGIFYAPYKLFKLMSRGGVDLFPPFDAMCYVEGDASKHHEAEDHLYHTMAILSTTHNFSWSRWNLLAGRRNMVLQMREFKDRKKLTNYNILHVTPLKACFVDCTEVSQAFTEQGVQGMKVET
uniref:CASC1 C-terminal domain-containing protein n=1 Tax=Timema poppense TaxID=170557 RepID=A0A7R9HC30_TIMPO|nr:unnamed protein product [Timema poppensis]